MPETTATVTAAAALQDDLRAVLAGEVGAEAATPLDAVMFDRLVLGRAPATGEGAEDAYRARTEGRTVRDFLMENLPGTDAQHAYPHVPCTSREFMWERGDGLRIWFNLRDLGVGMQIVQGTFDPEVEAVLTHLVQPGALCLDIGANLGLYALVMARAGGRVHAFEAFPYSHALLCRNVAENGLEERITAHHAACSDRGGAGSVCFASDSVNMGEMFVIEEGAAPAGRETVGVPLVRVDDAIPSHETVDVVKLDVEGAELAVLGGMERIIARDRPVIVMELNSFTLRRHRGVEAHQVMDLLYRHGYRAAEAGSMLTRDPVWVGDLPAGCDVFANVVCWSEPAAG